MISLISLTSNAGEFTEEEIKHSLKIFSLGARSACYDAAIIAFPKKPDESVKFYAKCVKKIKERVQKLEKTLREDDEDSDPDTDVASINK